MTVEDFPTITECYTMQSVPVFLLNFWPIVSQPDHVLSFAELVPASFSLSEHVSFTRTVEHNVLRR